jgi:hypothetical protein
LGHTLRRHSAVNAQRLATGRCPSRLRADSCPVNCWYRAERRRRSCGKGPAPTALPRRATARTPSVVPRRRAAARRRDHAHAINAVAHCTDADPVHPAALSQPARRATCRTAFPPNAGAQAPQQIQIREVTPAEYLAPQPTLAESTPTSPTRDGFRPQGTAPRDDDDSGASQAFRPPEIRRNAVAQPDASPQYAVGENYGTVRGQLEYWASTGQWSLRYQPVDTPADSLGGRLMIDNPQVLANLQPGEFVQLRGQLYAKPTDAGFSTPAYRVAAVERQRL